jgi:hypothetical protein
MVATIDGQTFLSDNTGLNSYEQGDTLIFADGSMMGMSRRSSLTSAGSEVDPTKNQSHLGSGATGGEAGADGGRARYYGGEALTPAARPVEGYEGFDGWFWTHQ